MLGAVRAASVGELATVDRDGVAVRGVLPLAGGRGPVLAYTYAQRELAERLSAATETVLTLSEPRGSGAAFTPLALRCRPVLSEDRDGERFVDELLHQELVRWPPSRAYADSPLLRREYWWWLPRLLVDLEVLSVEPFAARLTPRDHVLAVSQEGRDLAVALARVGAEEAEPAAHPEAAVQVDVQHGTPGAGRAVLFGQDLSFPDLERWGQWSWSGDWDGVFLSVRRAPQVIGLPPVPGLMQRWRRHRALERACVRALRRR